MDTLTAATTLSMQEWQVFQLMAREFKKKEIAAALGLTLQAVKTRVFFIKQKLGKDLAPYFAAVDNVK